jgi:ribokinase
MHKRGIETVIITMGAMGAYLSDRISGVRKFIPGFSVDAVDSTAAGDVFNGQLAVSLAEGKKFERAVIEAHGAAALSVQKLGAQSSIPRREETCYFLEEQNK